MVNAAVWSDAFSVRSTFLLSDMIWFPAIVFRENGDCLKLDRKTSASGIRKYYTLSVHAEFYRISIIHIV